MLIKASHLLCQRYGHSHRTYKYTCGVLNTCVYMVTGLFAVQFPVEIKMLQEIQHILHITKCDSQTLYNIMYMKLSTTYTKISNIKRTCHSTVTHRNRL